MRAGLIGLVVLVVGGLIVALNSFFIVNPMQQALVLQFGEVRQAVRDPGINAKIPIVQDVLYLDKRVLDLNIPAQEIIAADQKRLVVDAFMRYRIANPVRFYQTVNNVREGATRLSTFAQSSLRAVLADATFQAIVRDDRPELMRRISADVAARARDIGVEVVDVKIRRADLPEANSEAIFARMQTEREQEATQIRAQGREAAQRVQAAADRTATVLRAEAQREAEQIRGEGDGQKNAIFASAYSQDPQFFAFYRAMQAYEDALASSDTRLVLSPDADFFRYFNDPLGQARRSSDTSVFSGAAPAIAQPAAPATAEGDVVEPQASLDPLVDPVADPRGALRAAEAALATAEDRVGEDVAEPSTSEVIDTGVDPTQSEVAAEAEGRTASAAGVARPLPASAEIVSDGEAAPDIEETQPGTVTIVRPGQTDE